jgi:glutathione S-transferase
MPDESLVRPADTQPLTLFGAPVGLYAGKIRSYLRKQGIPYVERLPSDPVFQSEVMPAARRFINPVIRMSDGTLVQDTADIIDYLENNGHAAFSVYPGLPLQRLVALTLDMFGGEGLVRAAMHYRWSYREYNEPFLRHEFGLAFRAVGLPDSDINARLDRFMGRLNAYIGQLGINPTSTPAIEAAYEELLASLDAHFRVHPYLLGGRPTVADFGFIATMFAHLGRDPWPANHMRLHATSVFRWTERMLACDPDTPEFPGYDYNLPQTDEVPVTLGPVLRLMAQDYLPEIRMVVEFTDAWLAQQGELPVGTIVGGKPDQRNIGQGTFRLRGVELESWVMPYTLYMLQRITDAFAALAPAEQVSVRRYFAAHGLEELLTLKAQRRVERRDHIEVWG